MTKLKIWGLLCLLSVMTVQSRAQDNLPDFDSPAGISALLSSATPKLQKERIHRLLTIKRVKKSNKTGIYVPSLGAGILRNPTYLSAKEYLPQLELLEPQVREPIKAEWTAIEGEKDQLYSESSKIDATDDQLYQATFPLNQEKASLEQKQDVLNGDIDRYNSDCANRPLPPDEYNACQTRRAALVERIQRLNVEIDAYNAKVEAWQRNLASLKSRSAALEGRIPPWLEKTGRFAKTAEDALSKAQITSVRVQAQGGGLEESVKMNVPRPVTLSEGNRMLDELWLKLSPTQQQQRVDAFLQARVFMRETSVVGGVTAPPKVSRSFSNNNPNPPDARVDVEIFRGRAFVDGIGKAK